MSAPAISAGDEDPALVAICTSVAATFQKIERSHGLGNYHDGVISVVLWWSGPADFEVTKGTRPIGGVPQDLVGSKGASVRSLPR